MKQQFPGLKRNELRAKRKEDKALLVADKALLVAGAKAMKAELKALQETLRKELLKEDRLDKKLAFLNAEQDLFLEEYPVFPWEQSSSGDEAGGDEVQEQAQAEDQAGLRRSVRRKTQTSFYVPNEESDSADSDVTDSDDESGEESDESSSMRAFIADSDEFADGSDDSDDEFDIKMIPTSVLEKELQRRRSLKAVGETTARGEKTKEAAKLAKEETTAQSSDGCD